MSLLHRSHARKFVFTPSTQIYVSRQLPLSERRVNDRTYLFNEDHSKSIALQGNSSIDR